MRLAEIEQKRWIVFGLIRGFIFLRRLGKSTEIVQTLPIRKMFAGGAHVVVSTCDAARHEGGDEDNDQFHRGILSGYWTEQPSWVEHSVTLSWLHGVGVPVHVVVPVDQKQFECPVALQLVWLVNCVQFGVPAQPADVPHWQPVTAVQAVDVVSVLQALTHVLPLYMQPACAMHAAIASPLQTVAVPVQLDVQPGQLSQP
jgi:hypothetical protein